MAAMDQGQPFEKAMEEAVGLHRAGRFGDAAARYRAVLAAHPEQPDALHLLGLCTHRLGDVWPGPRSGLWSTQSYYHDDWMTFTASGDLVYFPADDGTGTELTHDEFVADLVSMCTAVVSAPA